jgi:hypothetical protein
MSGTTPINNTKQLQQGSSKNNKKKSKKRQSHSDTKKKNKNHQNQQHSRGKTAGKNPHHKKSFQANYSVLPQQPPQVLMVPLGQPAPTMLQPGSVIPMTTIPMTMSMPMSMSMPMPMAMPMPIGSAMPPAPQHMMQPMVGGQIQVLGVGNNSGGGSFGAIGVESSFEPPLPPSSLPEGWSEHYTSSGVKYYYDANTGTSTYEAPSISVKKNTNSSVCSIKKKTIQTITIE